MNKRINPHKMFTGLFVPTWLLVRPEISTSAKHVYALLANHAREDGEVFPSHGRLARGLGISERTVRYALSELERLGLVEQEAGLGRATSRYYFLWNVWMEGENEVTGKYCRTKPLCGKVAQIARQSGTKSAAISGKHIEKVLREERKEDAQARATGRAALARKATAANLLGDPVTPAQSKDYFARMLQALEPKGRA